MTNPAPDPLSLPRPARLLYGLLLFLVALLAVGAGLSAVAPLAPPSGLHELAEQDASPWARECHTAPDVVGDLNGDADTCLEAVALSRQSRAARTDLPSPPGQSRSHDPLALSGVAFLIYFLSLYAYRRAFLTDPIRDLFPKSFRATLKHLSVGLFLASLVVMLYSELIPAEHVDYYHSREYFALKIGVLMFVTSMITLFTYLLMFWWPPDHFDGAGSRG